MSKTVAQQQLGRQSGFANVRWARAELLYPHPVAVIPGFSRPKCRFAGSFSQSRTDEMLVFLLVGYFIENYTYY